MDFMNKLETNALRIAELMGYKATKDNQYFTHTKKQYQRAIDYNELIFDSREETLLEDNAFVYSNTISCANWICSRVSYSDSC